MDDSDVMEIDVRDMSADTDNNIQRDIESVRQKRRCPPFC